MTLTLKHAFNIALNEYCVDKCYIESDSLSYIDMLHHVCASLTSAQIASYADIMKGIASCLCKSYISTDFIIR